MTHVVTLDLSGIKSASGANWRLLGEVLRQDGTIESISLRRCGLRGTNLEMLLSQGLLLAPKSGVRNLVLSDNPLGHDVPGSYSTAKLATRELLHVIDAHSPLRVLDASRCLLPPEAVVTVRAAALSRTPEPVAFVSAGNCPREELLNCLTHGLGVIFAAIGSKEPGVSPPRLRERLAGSLSPVGPRS